MADDAVKITVSDPDTGKVLEEKICRNDYCVIVAGSRYVDHIRVMGRTHIVTIKNSLAGR